MTGSLWAGRNPILASPLHLLIFYTSTDSCQEFHLVFSQICVSLDLCYMFPDGESDKKGQFLIVHMTFQGLWVF